VVCLFVVLYSTGGLSNYGGVFIRFSTGLLVLFGIASLIKGIRRPETIQFFDSAAEQARISTGVLLLAGYLVLIPIIGFVFASLLFYLIMSLTLKDKPLSAMTVLSSIVQAVVVVGVLYSLFYFLLQVPLPAGMWAD